MVPAEVRLPATAIESDAASAACPGEQRIGQVIAGTYRLVRFLAAGGSGDVYEAEHLRLARPFAVKLLRAGPGRADSVIHRFRREARAIAKVHSEFVVASVDCGVLDDHTPYLAMELLQGEDLGALLRREGTLPARRALQIVTEACTGLAAVHAAGLVHRDIKPENLFITRRASGADWCKLLDFGVAKLEASQATGHGAILGTIRYMAPEQLADGAQVSPATDVHALGAVLFECLSGRPVYTGATVQELMYSVMNATPPSLLELRPELPRALAQLVQCCLAKSPADRPASAQELLSRLRGQLESFSYLELETATLSEDAAPGATIESRATRWPRPPLPAWWGLSVAAAALLGSGAHAMMAERTTSASSLSPLRVTVSELVRRAHAGVPPRPIRPNVPIPIPVGTAQAAPEGAASPSPMRAVPRTRARTPRDTGALSIGQFDRANPYGE
jgi:serine/threonine-protein kinase